MGLLNFAGNLLVGTLEVGFKVGGVLLDAAIDAAIETTREANQIKSTTGGMSDQQLLNGYMDSSNSMAERMAYGSAFKDRYKK